MRVYAHILRRQYLDAVAEFTRSVAESGGTLPGAPGDAGQSAVKSLNVKAA